MSGHLRDGQRQAAVRREDRRRERGNRGSRLRVAILRLRRRQRKGETKAEPKIWSEMDKFKAASTKMQEEMAKLNVVAKGGNIDAIKAAVGETGKSCKACHDNYRKE